MGRFNNGIPKGLNRRIVLILATMAVSMTPIWIAVAQSPIVIDLFTIDAEVSEAIAIDKKAFTFRLKPGECEEDEVTISNSANVSLDPTLDPVITPNIDDGGFDLQMVTKHSVKGHDFKVVPFTVCLDPHAVIRDYHVDVSVLR